MGRLPLFRSAPSLKKADLSQTLSKETYRDMLAVRQERIEYLHHELYRQRIPMVMVYEGWDASGKGWQYSPVHRTDGSSWV